MLNDKQTSCNDINKYKNKLKSCLKYLYNDDNKVSLAVDFFNGEESNFKDSPDDIKIRILKGGSYKIKGYYLENNNLQDIRGASVLLTYVEETVIPKMISIKFNESCIIYCGGGNIFAVLPEDCPTDFNIDLEREAQKYLISGNIAYYLSKPMNISQILGDNYRLNMVMIENALDERKKTKIYNNPSMESSIFTAKGVSLIDSLTINPKKYPLIDKTCICDHCNSKIAKYQANYENLCASCLHKNIVGKHTKKSKYISEYKKYTKQEADVVQSLSDIDKDYIAIVYGDGNNMGGIIQNLNKITDMMQFSNTVKNVANKSVFSAMKDNNIKKFEVVGLGGDDVFVIVEAKKSIKFALSLIKYYNQDFKEKYEENPSTMAVGIAIAKTNTPVKIILEQAEEELSKAKKLCKEKVLAGGQDTGALSFTIIDSYEGNNENLTLDYGAKNTLLPYETETAEKIISYVDKIKEPSISKTKIYNLSEGFKKAESIDEAKLFFNYMNAKEKDKDNRIELPSLPNFELDNAFYTKNGEILYLWDDIINLLDYTDGGTFNEEKLQHKG